MKIGIVTIYDNNNYGNRLQNYAVQEIIKKKLESEVITYNNLINSKNTNERIIVKLKKCIKHYTKFMKSKRYRVFCKFSKERISNNNKIIDIKDFEKKENVTYLLVGSDQVWNPKFERLSPIELLSFIDDEKRISFSASFGIETLPEKFKEKTKNELEKFKKISVREDAGKKIVEDLTGRTDVEVLVDPTMLLTAEEWNKVAKKPSMLKNDKYILNYYLGTLSENRKKEIERIAKENDCDIINILDKNSPFYECGPSEFLYLEKNAFLICTDSFHSCVFAILYNRPFIIFNREQVGMSNMNSRIETLLSKFELTNRQYNEKSITKENLEHDYTRAYEILENEREKSLNFLKKALDIKE